MKELKPKELRKLKDEDLYKKLKELKLELMKEMGNIRMKRPSKNTKKALILRKGIARILTILRERGVKVRK